MEKTKVYIFGTGLYGIILAILLNKKKYNVTIVDQSDEILSSFKPIKISKYLINNGFHGIDYPRGRYLINFLKTKIKVNLTKIKIEKMIIIGRFVVNYFNKFQEYPAELKKKFIKKNLKFYKSQKLNFFFSKKFMKDVLINTKRYSSNPKVAEGFFLPYFLPSDTKHINSDEGDIFRNKNRNKKKISYFYAPKNGIFYNLRHNFYKILKKEKINILNNHRIDIDKNYKIKLINKKNDIKNLPKNTKIYFCMSAVFFLKFVKNNMIDELKKNKREFYNALIKIKKGNLKNQFSEALSLNKKIFYVNRITKNYFIKDNEYDFYQIEILKNKISDTNQIKKELENELYKIFKCKIYFVGLKLSRITFHPDNDWFLKAEKIVKKLIKKLPYKISIRYCFYPVNMNKAWIWANEDRKF